MLLAAGARADVLSNFLKRPADETQDSALHRLLIPRASRPNQSQLANQPSRTDVPLQNRSETRNPSPKLPTPETRTPNPEPRTPNPEPRTPNPEPRTPSPEPENRKPKKKPKTESRKLKIETRNPKLQVPVAEWACKHHWMPSTAIH